MISALRLRDHVGSNTACFETALMPVRRKHATQATYYLLSALIFIQLIAILSACIVKDASPFVGNRGSMIPSISLPLSSGGCSCADNECVFVFTQIPSQGALYEMGFLAHENQVYINRTSPKLQTGDKLRSSERANFGRFVFVPSFKFYGSTVVKFNFSYNGIVSEKNFSLIVHFNNSVPYSGEGGHMLSFDGYDDFVQATVPLKTKLYGNFPAFSFSFWVRNTKRRSGQVLISAWAEPSSNSSAKWIGGRQWALFDTGNLNFQVNGKSLSEGTGFDIRDSKWHLVCMSWKIKSGLVDIFVDGSKNTISAPEWEPPEAVILMLGNMQLVTEIIPSQKAENDVLLLRSFEKADTNLADSSLSPSYADKWSAAQSMASSLLSNLNGGMGSPKTSGTLAGIPSSYTHIFRGVQDSYRYAMFGTAECNCAGFGATTKFAFGGHFDEFRMFNEAKDTIDFSFSMNHMYSPTMFERYQTPDSSVATNSFASGEAIKYLENLWIYWNFDYIYDFLANDALSILESLRSSLILQDARGSSDLFDTRLRSVQDNKPQTAGIAGKLGDDYYSFRVPARVISDAPLMGSALQFFSIYPDGNFSVLNLAVEDFENQTNILVRIENMPVVGSIFQVNQDGSLGDPILARGTVITNNNFKIAYRGDRGLCKTGVKVFNVEGDLVDKDTAADAFDIYIKDVKIIPPILNPDTPPALRFSKIVLMCALYRAPVTIPNIVAQTVQNSSIMFELQALSLEKPSSMSLVITQLPLRGSLWTTRWIRVGCNDTTLSCICGEDPIECDASWSPRKECNNETLDNAKKYNCLLRDVAVNVGVRFENPLNVIYSPTEFFWGNDSVSFNVVMKNSDGGFSQGFNEEKATIIVIPKTNVQAASLILSPIPNITSGDTVNISFGIIRENIDEDLLLLRIVSFPMHGILMFPSRASDDQSDSQGVPHGRLSKTFDITFDGFTKSNAIVHVFQTKTASVKKNLKYRNFTLSGDATHAGRSHFTLGMHKLKNLDFSKASMNTSQTFESVCGDVGVVQSYVEFSGFFTVERVRLMSSLPLDTFIRFVAPQSITKGNSTTIKRNTQYVSGATKFENCPGVSCLYPWAYNVRRAHTERPNLLKTESSFNNVQSDDLYEYWRGFAGEGQKSTSQNSILDFSFSSSLPTKFLIIEMCGTRQSWPGLTDGGNPIDEVQGLIVRVTKGGSGGILPVGIRTLMYRSSPTFTGQDRFKLSVGSIDGRIFTEVEASVNVITSRAYASKYVTNLQQEVGIYAVHTLATEEKNLRYEFLSKYPEEIELLRLDSTVIGSIAPNLLPDASGKIILKLGSDALCGENAAFAFFRISRKDGNVLENGHNVSISLVCPIGLICISSLKRCKPCQSGTFYNDPPAIYNPILAQQVPSGFCQPCDPGYYTDTPGQTFCKMCDAGFSSAQRSSSCEPCGKGHFNPKSGGLCTPCARGQFQPYPGQSFCHACGFLGFSTANTSVQCADCPVNMHAEYEKTFNVALCTCNSGYYRLSRSKDPNLMSEQSCLPCPPGAFCAGMDLLPVPKNGFWTDTSLWSNGTTYFLQCFHRGVSNQCQGYPTIDYQYNHEICKFRDTELCFQGENDVDTFRSYTKNIACSNEYSGKLCFECSEGDMLSARNFLGACVLCPADALGYVGIFVQSILVIAVWTLILLGLVCRVHCVSLVLVHFQLLALFSDASVQNSAVVDSFLKGFHLFMFDLNFIPWSCIIRTGFPLFFKHVVQLVILWSIVMMIDLRGTKMVRNAILFRVQYNFLKSKISTDGINNVDRRSIRSRNTSGDNSSLDDASSLGSVNSKGEARSWKNLFQSSQSERSETPVVDLMRPNTAGSGKSHNSWFSKVSAWRKQHVKHEDAKLQSRKLMTTEEIDQLRDEQYRVLLALSQALTIPILYNSLVMLPCLEYSDKVLRMMWIPTYECTTSAYVIMSIIGILTAFWFAAWVPGKFIHKCVSLWLQDDWDHPQFINQHKRIFTLTERKHRWWFFVLTLHGPVLCFCIILSQVQPATGIAAALVWIGFKTILTAYMRPYIMTKHNVFSFILDLHLSVACSCALYRTNIFSANYLSFTLDRFEVSTDALDGLIHIVAFMVLLGVASFAILIDCINSKVKIPPSVAIVFNVLTGKPHAVFRTFLTDAWNFWQKMNRKYAKWVRPRTSLVHFGKDVQRTECRERADVVRDSIIALNAGYPTESPFIFDTIENDLGEWAAHPRKAFHFINACMIRIQELETINSKSDKILALQSKVNCALRCLINFHRLDYEDAFQRQYQLQGYAETLVWDIDVMNRHLQKLEIGIEGRDAVGQSTQQLMDHMDRRVPDIMNWRKRYEHERDRRLLIQKKIDELNMFMKQYMNSSDDDDEDGKPTIPTVQEQAGEAAPTLGPRYRPAELLPAFYRD